MTSEKIRVADFIIQYLADLGITDMFVVYGSAIGDLVDAFTKTDKTRYIAVMHEQGGGFAAECYAKISGKPGVTIATSGPGGMNMVTPIGNCYYDSVPCLFITGQVNSQFLRPDPTVRQVGFQETDIVSIVKPITKYAVMIQDAASIKYELQKALFLAREGRPGPVLIDLPLNIAKELIEPDKLHGFDAEAAKTAYNFLYIDKKIDLLLQDLLTAKRPVMLVGGGVQMAGAAEDLWALGEKLKAPIFPTWNALDTVASDWKWYGGRVGTYGGRGRNFGLQNADLLLSVGSRISGRITGGNLTSFARKAKKWVVDVDPALLQKKLQQVPFDENVFCDAKIFLRRLHDKLASVTLPDVSEWTKKVMQLKEKYDPVLPEYCKPDRQNVHPYYFFRTLSEEMGPNDILVGDCGGNIVASNHSFETKRGQRNITNNGNSPMGFSFAGAMGAWLGSDKKRKVIATIGDGGFNMNIQEIETVMNYNLGFKTFIIDNRIYGITKAYQKTNFQGRMEACGPKGYNPPDFIKICQAYGMPTAKIENNAGVREGIQKVLAMEGPVVCVVNCFEEHAYNPRIFGWKTPIEDMYPYLPREEFKENMIGAEPIEGWEHPAMPDIV